ncbi:HSPB1-associated protein 1 [Anopheles marshallii]|uniref:HSPB1-associated protein 1 n=1 Tax=Anopheles marshallii TaxID=1521116 RepID=UPI00237C30F6|nr:HSPB1-associated protein 1 [Anopheles marshallii]
MDPAKLKEIVLNAKQPYVLHNVNPQWCCFQQTFDEWCKSFDDVHQDSVPFDECSVKGGIYPQWESQRTRREMKMGDICRRDTHHKTERWNSFSYRNIALLPEPCRKGINFAYFGFPEVEDDITFWIGSAQAHTPCHYDTYGCNIVMQIFGRKSWTLLPPTAKLTPVRVPFEESSVYCEENFYSPASYSPFAKVENDVYHTVLEPGMALIVPPKWWHYVETLEPALNFNTWLSLETDVDSLISECITKLLLQDLCDGVADNIKSHIINPNEDLLTSTSSMRQSYDILNYLLDQKRNNKQQCTEPKRYPSNYLSNDAFERLIEECKYFIQPVEKLQQCGFFDIISTNHSRYDSSQNDGYFAGLTPDETELVARLRKLVNMSCKSDVVKLIENVLLENRS